MDISDYIIKQVQKLIQSKGYSQETIGEIIGLGKVTMNKRMLGHTAFKTTELVAIAQEFDVDINYIVTPGYEQEQKELQEMKLNETHEPYVVHPPQEKTLSITLEVPISGGLKIPEDINEQILYLIKKSQ